MNNGNPYSEALLKTLEYTLVIRVDALPILHGRALMSRKDEGETTKKLKFAA